MMYFAVISCGIAVASACFLDPALHDRPRTEIGCREAAIQAAGWTDGWKAKCVKIERAK